MTDSPPHPDPIVARVVCLPAPLAMANDGIVATQRAPPREQLHRERRHPGSVLSSASGSAIKRITAGVKACTDRRCQLSCAGREPSLRRLAGYVRPTGRLDGWPLVQSSDRSRRHGDLVIGPKRQSGKRVISLEAPGRTALSVNTGSYSPGNRWAAVNGPHLRNDNTSCWKIFRGSRQSHSPTLGSRVRDEAVADR